MKQKVSVPFMLLGILFNVCLIAANLLETKVIQVFGITVTAGLLVFPISYIINDCIGDTTIYRMEETALAQVLTLAALGLS